MLQMLDQPDLVFARILELSDLMLTGAINAQWDSVIELQALRDDLIRKFFTAERQLELDGQVVAEGIRHISECDGQLFELAAEERKSLQKQIIALKQGKDVVRAYSDI